MAAVSSAVGSALAGLGPVGGSSPTAVRSTGGGFRQRLAGIGQAVEHSVLDGVRGWHAPDLPDRHEREREPREEPDDGQGATAGPGQPLGSPPDGPGQVSAATGSAGGPSGGATLSAEEVVDLIADDPPRRWMDLDDGDDFEELANRLYAHLVTRLRFDVLVERERSGTLLDFG